MIPDKKTSKTKSNQIPRISCELEDPAIYNYIDGFEDAINWIRILNENTCTQSKET